jgi:hypothetical protein
MQPKTVSELFPSKYIACEDLQGKTFSLIVHDVSFEVVRDKFSQQDETKACVWFVGAEKGLLLNKTQAMALAQIAGTEEFSKWVGVKVILRPGRAPNGKLTIVVATLGDLTK